MKTSHKTCTRLLNTTIYAKKFEGAIELKESSSDNRVFATDELIFKFSPHIESLRYEYNCYQLLHENELFPLPFAFMTDNKGAILIVNRLDGTTDLADVWKDLSKEKKCQFAMDVVNAVKSWKTIETSYLKKSCPWNNEISRLQTTILSSPHTEEKRTKELLDQWIKSSSSLGKGTHMIHNDLWIKNFLQKDGKLIGIIDFEIGFLGNVAIEGLRLDQQRYFAKEEKIDAEIELISLIIKRGKKVYPEMFDWSKNLYNCVHLYHVLKSLANRKEEYYNHGSVMGFYKEFFGE